MSLVGTRPPTVDEYEQYELGHRKRLAMKPGLTGMWQVSGRSDITDFDEVVAYIASRDLDETDQQKLEEYKEKDPDYVRGVKEGWSILFLGECQKYVICPGIVPRAEMAQKVKEDYRKLTPDITYLYSDGTKVFDE